MILKTEAVVLKTINQGDTSKIATLYTREQGRIKMIAKGVRNTKSRYLGLLDPVQHVEVLFYEKSNSDLQLFKSGEIVQSYYTLHKDFDRLAFAQVAMEFIERAAEKTEPHPELFEIIIGTLASLDNPKIMPVKSYWYFHLRCLGELGFRFDAFRCHQCKTTLVGTRAVYHRPDAAIYCTACSPTPDERFIINLSPRTMAIMQMIDGENWPGIQQVITTLSDRRSLWDFIWHYTKVHLPPIEQMKSLAVLEQIYHHA